MVSYISESDIEQLLHNPSIKSRAEVAQKVSRGYGEGQFSGRERQIAHEILKLLLRDVSAKVRKAMALELCDGLDVPHDVIWGLANDSDDEVATCVLSASPALSEEELMMLVQSARNMQRVLAVSKRPSISASLSDVIARNGDAPVTRSLLDNQGALIAEATLEHMLERFHDEDAVLEGFVYRGGLPYAFAEQLFSKVADHLKRDLSKRYRLNRVAIDDAASGARETAVLEFLSPWMSQQEVIELVNSMSRSKRLSESVMIRALCAGNVRFFEAAIAKRAGISIQNARILLLDAGPRGFDALYDAAQMPESFRKAIAFLFKQAQQETSFGKYYHQHFAQRMLERLTEESHNQTIENLDVLMTLIGRSNKDGIRIH